MEGKTLQETVTKLLAAYGGNQSLLARTAGVSQNTIWKLINKDKLNSKIGIGYKAATGLASASNGAISSMELLRMSAEERKQGNATAKGENHAV
jgi:DNA-binding XRE family transcriptional regulator